MSNDSISMEVGLSQVTEWLRSVGCLRDWLGLRALRRAVKVSGVDPELLNVPYHSGLFFCRYPQGVVQSPNSAYLTAKIEAADTVYRRRMDR